jgi:ATP-dependent RNA helicase DDX18/HAS1
VYYKFLNFFLYILGFQAEICVYKKQLEKLINKNYYLHQSARDGFRSYLSAYAAYSLKGIYDIHRLDLAKVGKAFGFAVPPAVNLPMGQSLKSGRKRSAEDAGDEEGKMVSRSEVKGRDRRKEDLTRKQLEREKYRNAAVPRDGNIQWSR